MAPSLKKERNTRITTALNSNRLTTNAVFTVTQAFQPVLYLQASIFNLKLTKFLQLKMLQDPSSAAFKGRRDQPLNYTVTHRVPPALSHSGGLRLLEIDVTGVRIVNFLVRAGAIWNAAIRERISHISAFHVSVWLYQSPVRSDLVLALCVTMLVWFWFICNSISWCTVLHKLCCFHSWPSH